MHKYFIQKKDQQTAGLYYNPKYKLKITLSQPYQILSKKYIHTSSL